MSTVYPIHKAPYTNYHDLNLDWVIESLNDFNTRLTNFVSLATIKYADPIQWDITSQYEANTVVVDSNGNAYLSVQPVPSGISLDRTEYWTKIGNFDELWADVKKAITPIDEGHSTTATAARAVDDLVWVDGSLVRITKAMDAGDAYVEGSNCVSSSTNEVLHYLLNTFNEGLSVEQQAREEADTRLQDAITAEQTAREEAITDEQQAREEADSQLQEAITAEQQAREEADSQLQEVTSSLQSSVSKIMMSGKTWIDASNPPPDTGLAAAVGDGVADDTDAINAAIVYCINHGAVLFLSGKYRIKGRIYLSAGLNIIGCGTNYSNYDTTNRFDLTLFKSGFIADSSNEAFLSMQHAHGCYFSNFAIVNIGYSVKAVYMDACRYCNFDNIRISFFSYGIEMGSQTTGSTDNSMYNYIANVHIDRCDLGLHLFGSSDDVSNACHNVFVACHFDINSNAIVIDWADNNTFVGIFTFQRSGTHAYVFNPKAGSNYFIHSQGAATNKANINFNNFLLFHDRGNGQPFPVGEGQGNLWVLDSLGNIGNARDNKQTVYSVGGPYKIDTPAVGSIRWNTDTSSGYAGQMYDGSSWKNFGAIV